MNQDRNEQLLTPRPAASNLVGQAGHTQEDLDGRRAAAEARTYSKRKRILGGIGALILGAGAAGGGHALIHDIDRGARDAINNRTEAVDNAFSGPAPVVTGEPSNVVAAHQAQVNQAHNAAVEANKVAQDVQTK